MYPILCDPETSTMPRSRTDLGCKVTEKRKCHILRLTTKKCLAIAQVIFVRLLTERTGADIQVTLCGFCGERSGRERDFPLMLRLLCQIITPPVETIGPQQSTDKQSDSLTRYGICGEQSGTARGLVPSASLPPIIIAPMRQTH